MPTDECSKTGGQSEAGHCPGPKDIQCCTHPTTQSSDDDQKSSDDNDDDVEDPNEDDDEGSNDEDDGGSNDDNDDEDSNDDDDDDQESNDEGSCKIGSGTLGTCISTADCSSNGGTSEAGHCPGAANIQVSFFPLIFHVRIIWQASSVAHINPVKLKTKKGNASQRQLALALLHLDIALVLTTSNAALPELGPHKAITNTSSIVSLDPPCRHISPFFP